MDNQNFSYQIQPDFDNSNTNIIKLKFVKDFSNSQNKSDFQSPTKIQIQYLEKENNNLIQHDLSNLKISQDIQSESIQSNIEEISQTSQISKSETKKSEISKDKIVKKQIQKSKIDPNIVTLSQEEIINKAIDSSFKFNRKILQNKLVLQQHMKKIENLISLERQTLNNQVLQGNCIPLIINDNNKFLFDANSSFKVGKTTIENFINQNILQEQQASYQNLIYGNNQIGFARRFQRRRRRKRNAFGVLEDRLPVV